METPLAASGASKFHDLIGHLIAFGRPLPPAQPGPMPARHSAVRRLAEDEAPSAETADRSWLQRIEIRSSEAVARALAGTGFHAAPGEMSAIFVDNRCGLIRAQPFGPVRACDPRCTSGRILRHATACHAGGIILATSDGDGALARSPRLQALTANIERKGEAIDIFLLDHFVWTGRGWQRLGGGTWGRRS